MATPDGDILHLVSPQASIGLGVNAAILHKDLFPSSNSHRGLPRSVCPLILRDHYIEDGKVVSRGIIVLKINPVASIHIRIRPVAAVQKCAQLNSNSQERAVG